MTPCRSSEADAVPIPTTKPQSQAADDNGDPPRLALRPREAAKALGPGFPRWIDRNGMIRACSPMIQVFPAIMTGASDG